jgi:pyruvate-formate lyase
MDSQRIATLVGHRDARERLMGIGSAVDGYDVGEANGRIRTGVDLRSSLPPTPWGPRGFVAALRAILAASPVEVRPREMIVGDYYHCLFGMQDRWLHAYWNDTVIAGMTSGHTAVNVADGLAAGWAGIRGRIRSSLQRWSDEGEADRIEYLRCLEEVVASIQDRIAAYADAAEESALASVDPGVRNEHAECARIARRLVHEPPSTFREALQWYWFFVTFERATSSGMGACRLDQVFLPFYEADLAAGRIDREGAKDLVAALLLKEGLFYCLGGTDGDGADAVNDLSWIALEAYDAVGGPSNLNVRWHEGIDERFFAYAIEILHRRRTGVPLLVNDAVVVPSLTQYGFPLAEARGYTFSGCFWYVLPGREYPYHDMEAVSGALILTEAMRRAFRDHPSRFEDLYRLYEETETEIVDAFHRGLAEVDRDHYRHMPEMVISLLLDGCIDRARDATDGGTESSLTTVRFVGLATVADSLTAIRKIVYEEKLADLATLEAALAADFTGFDELRHKLLVCPKFGNDDPVADLMASRVAESFKSALRGRLNIHGFAFRPAFYSHMGHVAEGKALGATPDGRRAGAPLSQGANPTQGRARSGPTATVSSLARLRMDDTAGAPFQLHLSGDPSPEAREALRTLVLTAFRKGLMQVNANYTDRATLIAAMAKPEEHWDLVIRVTGYSARFVQIGASLQEEIVSRTVY